VDENDDSTYINIKYKRLDDPKRGEKFEYKSF